MTTVKPVPAITHRGTVVALISLLVLLGTSALAGGITMLFGNGGAGVPPQVWLDGIPLIDSWVVPGLVLGIGFGVGSLVVAHGVIRRPEWQWLEWMQRSTGQHWSWIGALAIGAGQVVWILLELVFLPEPTWLQAVYGSVGAGIVILAVLPSVRHHLIAYQGLWRTPRGRLALADRGLQPTRCRSWQPPGASLSMGTRRPPALPTP